MAGDKAATRFSGVENWLYRWHLPAWKSVHRLTERLRLVDAVPAGDVDFLPATVLAA
jgi:hypothetical protein